MKSLIALLMAFMFMFGNALATGNDIYKPELYGPGTENPTLSPYHESFLDAQWYDTMTEHNNICLHTSPDNDSACLTHIPIHAFLLTASYNSEYSYVCYNQYEGFVNASELSKDLPEQNISLGYSSYMASYIGIGCIVNCNEFVSLRKYPNARYDSLRSVPLGAPLDVYSYNDDFYLCSYDKKLGYIKCEYVSFASDADDSFLPHRSITDTYAPTGYLAQINDMTPAAYNEYIQEMDNNSGRQPNNSISIGSFDIGEEAASYIEHGQNVGFTQKGFFDALFTALNDPFFDMGMICDETSQAVASDFPAYTFRMVGSELYAWGIINYEGGITADYEECYAFEATKDDATYLLCAYFFLSEGGEGIELKCLSQY